MWVYNIYPPIFHVHVVAYGGDTKKRGGGQRVWRDFSIVERKENKNNTNYMCQHEYEPIGPMLIIMSHDGV